MKCNAAESTVFDVMTVYDAVVRELAIGHGEQRRVPGEQGRSDGVRSPSERKSDGRHIVIARAGCRSGVTPRETLVQVR